MVGKMIKVMFVESWNWKHPATCLEYLIGSDAVLRHRIVLLLHLHDFGLELSWVPSSKLSGSVGCTPFVYFSSRALHYLWNAQVIIKHIEHRYHKVRIDYRYIWQTPGTRSQKQGFATLPFDWCEFVPAQCLCQRMICWLNEAELKLFMLLREEQREVARSCLYIHMSILGICMKPESFSYIIYMHHFD